MKRKFVGLEKKIVDKSHKDYETDIMPWNRAIEARPSGIIYCETLREISAVLRVVKRDKIPLRIRSGRHHYEGFSTGDDVVILDVSRMKSIEIDEANKTFTIGAGVTNRELYDALNEKGYHFAGGGCPTVGVIGYTLGGGWGYSSRYLGLGCDNLLEVEIIANNGNVISASGNGHTQLFWALRGAGAANFGVVTSMTFALPKKEEKATLVLFDYKDISMNEKIEVIKTLQKEFKTIDNRFNAKTAIYNSDKNGKGIYMTGLFYGSKEEAKKILSPFMSIVKKANLKLEEMSVSEANNYIQDSHPEFEHYKSGGRFVYEDLTDKQIKELISVTEERPEGSIYVAVSFYGLGGVVDNYTNEDMSYCARGARFIIGMQSVWEDNKYKDINSEFIVNAYKSMMPITKGSYISFPIKELENYQEEFYGENLSKLLEAKRDYDVRDVFNFPQGIEAIEFL